MRERFRSSSVTWRKTPTIQQRGLGRSFSSHSHRLMLQRILSRSAKTKRWLLDIRNGAFCSFASYGEEGINIQIGERYFDALPGRIKPLTWRREFIALILPMQSAAIWTKHASHTEKNIRKIDISKFKQQRSSMTATGSPSCWEKAPSCHVTWRHLDTFVQWRHRP